MPSAEFIQTKETLKNAVSYSNYLKVFLLFTCPTCNRYTLHKPRFGPRGHCWVDHKRVPVYQTSLDGSREFVGIAPEDSCLVEDGNAITNIEQTRTVIRVK
jgi:hypothetical protein